MLGRLVPVLLLLVLAAPAVAQAPALQTPAPETPALQAAESAYASGSLRQARRQLEAALQRGACTTPELVRAHLMLGIVMQAFGDAAVADEHFAAALALDPALPSPSELTPEARGRFEALRPSAPLSLQISAPREAQAGQSVELSARAVSAPHGLVGSLELSGPAGAPTRAEGETLTATLPPEAWSPGALTVVARDPHGAVLASASWSIRVASPAPTITPPVTVAVPDRPLPPVVVAAVEPASTEAATVALRTEPPPPPSHGGDDTALWVGIAIGVVAAVALGVGLGVGLTPAGGARFGAPEVP